VREPWLDTGSAVRPLLIAIFGWVAEQERVTIVVRTKAGLKRARRSGVRLGRPPRAIDVQRARALISGGLSPRTFDRSVAAPHRARMKRACADGCSPEDYGTSTGLNGTVTVTESANQWAPFGKSGAPQMP